MKDLIIYALLDPDTHEVRYIGKSERGLERPRSHFYPNQLKIISKKTNWIKSVINKGKIPYIKILCECNDVEELNQKEIEFIAMFKNSGKLTNMTDGGTGGNTGGGQKRRKPILAMNVKTKEIIEYNYVWEAVKDGFEPNKIVAVCKGKRLTHKGYYFCYKKDGFNLRDDKSNTKIKILFIDGSAQTFDTRISACQHLGIHVSSLQYYLDHKQSIQKKFKGVVDIVKL